MATILRTEKRKRGIFGTLIWWAFLAFNAFMALATGLFTYRTSGASFPPGTVEPAIAIVATGIGVTFLLGLWLVGSLILGLIVALTRGRTVTVEKVVG